MPGARPRQRISPGRRHSFSRRADAVCPETSSGPRPRPVPLSCFYWPALLYLPQGKAPVPEAAAQRALLSWLPYSLQLVSTPSLMRRRSGPSVCRHSCVELKTSTTAESVSVSHTARPVGHSRGGERRRANVRRQREGPAWLGMRPGSCPSASRPLPGRRTPREGVHVTPPLLTPAGRVAGDGAG